MGAPNKQVRHHGFLASSKFEAPGPISHMHLFPDGFLTGHVKNVVGKGVNPMIMNHSKQGLVM